VSGWQPTALTELLQGFVADQILCLGAQVSVAHDGTVHELCFGSAGPDLPCTVDTVWRLFCAAKPAVAVAVGKLAAAGRIDLDCPISEQLSSEQLPTGPLAAGHVTPRQLLDHTAGLHGVHGYGVGALPSDRRHELVVAQVPPPGWDPRVHAGYSEYSAWHLLGLLLEASSGQSADVVLRSEVCQPLAGGELWFAMSDDEYRLLYPRLAVAYDLREPEPTPMLANRNRRPCTELNVAYGGYGTARGLRTLYGSLLGALRNDPGSAVDRATVAMLVGHRRGRRPDAVLRRPCDFGLGFMVELVDHGFEPWWSSQSFGHTGYYGTAMGLADPEHDVACAVVWNGIVDGDLGVRTRRNALLRALAMDLGIERGAARPAAVVAPGRPR